MYRKQSIFVFANCLLNLQVFLLQNKYPKSISFSI